MTEKTTAKPQSPKDPKALLQGLQKNMSKEQMQQLMAAMQKQQMTQMPKHKRYFMQFMQAVGPKLQAGVKHIDDFIGFLTKSSGDKDSNAVIQSARGPILFGTWVAIAFFGFGFMWAAIAPLDSASPAAGTIRSSTEKKIIQHREGGILREILVKQGDFVKEGEPLFILDDTAQRSSFEAYQSNYRTLKAEESRLKAERDMVPYITFSSKLLKDAEKYEVAKILEVQKNVFLSGRSMLEKEEKILKQQIAQNAKQIEALKEKKIAYAKGREVLAERLKANKTLFEKGVISRAAMSQIEKEFTDAKSTELANDAEIIRAEQETTNIETKLEAKRNEYLSRALENLKRTQLSLAEATQKYIQAKESLSRTVIRAPVDGTIIKVDQATIGGVVGQGTPLAELSPKNDNLIIEAKIAPKDIAYITPGMEATIRFQAFKSRTTPSFPGKVISLSPDVIIDSRKPDGDNAHYVARIEVDREEFEKDAKRLKLTLIPGMQADVQIRRGTRTLLRYLLDPITDNMFKAFKEK